MHLLRTLLYPDLSSFQPHDLSYNSRPHASHDTTYNSAQQTLNFSMGSLRASSFSRPFATARFSARPSSFAVKNRFYAGQSYGGGEGDPKGEKPQEQGSNPSADLEHPGPPPPDVGKGTGGGPTKAGEGGHNTQQNNSSGGSSGGGGKQSGASQSNGGPQPKIHSEGTPAEESAEVKAHNEDMGKRHDRAN